MGEVIDSLQAWLRQGTAGALATVISTWGSAPRRIGSKMAVNQTGMMVGSVSGGCVEAAVAQEALESLKDGRPRFLQYNVGDEQAWDVGLTCGGRLEVFVEPFESHGDRERGFAQQLEAIERSRVQGRPAVRTVVIRGSEGSVGEAAVFGEDGTSLGQTPRHAAADLSAEARRVAESGIPLRRTYSLSDGEIEVFFDPVMPPPVLVIVGGVHIATVLTRLAKIVGYRVVIVDPRRSFATAERFPEADEVLQPWPDEGLRRLGLTRTTAVAVLSHDPKLDDPALMVALRSPAAYVGALGSQRTNTARRTRLAAAGLTEGELDRLHAPIGLAGLGDSPEMIALGILAEIAALPSLRPGNPS